jgi:hypothetical protein
MANKILQKETLTYVDARLEKIFPQFLAKQKADFEAIKVAQKNLNYGELRRLGHLMKGTCGGYGLFRLGELGGKIEAGAEVYDPTAILDNIHLIEDYFSSLKVCFQKM